jgi:transposase
MAKVLKVTYRITADELSELSKRENDPSVRVRLLAIRLILLGSTGSFTAEQLGMTDNQTYFWLKRFNQSGPEGLRNRPRKPRHSRLNSVLIESFKARVRAGATASDPVSVLRGKDFQRILREDFSAECSLSGTYYILHKLGFSSLLPRPKHPQSDAEVQETFKKTLRTA